MSIDGWHWYGATSSSPGSEHVVVAAYGGPGVATGLASRVVLSPTAVALVSALALAAEAARTEVAPATRELALAAFAVSVERYGLLLERSDLRAVLVNYTDGPDAAVRKASGAIIDVIESPRNRHANPSLDVAPARPR